jgi:hypothetical protein
MSDSVDFFEDSQKIISSSSDFQTYTENIYTENIIAELSQNTSFIHHSVILNDRNMFGIDFSEPAFANCSFYLSFTNEHPYPFTPLPFSYETNLPSVFNFGFVGFLFYESSLPIDNILPLKNRVVQLFESRFRMNIIEPPMISEIGQYYFPFYGCFSNLSTIILDSIANMPQDGYFSSNLLNLPLNASYLASHFAQESVYYVNSLESLDNIATFLLEHSDTLRFDIHTPLNRIPLISLFNEVKDDSSLNSLAENIPSDLFTLTNDDFLLDLQDSPLVIVQISYLGHPEGIFEQDGVFIFDLHRALRLPTKTPITTSATCLDSFTGFFSGISLVCYSSEIVSISPHEFEISTTKIIPLQHVLFLASNGTEDFSEYEDYQWQVFFEIQGSISTLNAFPSKVRNLEINLEDFSDMASPYSLSFIPCLFLDPLVDLSIQYHPRVDPPVFDLQKAVIPLNGTEGVFSANESVSVSLNVTNRGNVEIWGLPLPKLASVGMNNLSPDNTISDRLEILGYNIEGMFSNTTPRYFPVDLSGEGFFSSFFPNILNESVRVRYSPTYTQTILDNLVDLSEQTSYNETQLLNYATTFNSSESLFNPSNWVIQPNETLKFSSHTILDSNDSSFINLDRARFRIGSKSSLEYTDLYSNSIRLLLNTSTSITALAHIDHNLSYCGEKNRYVLTLLPERNSSFSDVIVKVQSIGVLLDSGDFLHENGLLTLYLAHFNSTSTQTEFSFEFYSPNSMIISSAEIRWKEDTKEYLIHSNEIGLFANIFYTDAFHSPYLHKIELQNSLEIIDNQLLVMNCSLYNSGITEISGINLFPIYSADEFRLLNVTGASIIENLGPSSEYSAVMTFEILMPHAVLTPLIWINGSDLSLFTYRLDLPDAIGTPNISITKELHRKTGWTGQSLQIKITLTNIGDVPLQNVVIDDFHGFPPHSFSLTSGILQKTISLLEVGESYSLNYSLRIEQPGTFHFGKARVKYLYITPMVVESTEFPFRARSSLNLVLLLSLSGVVGGCCIIYVIWIRKKGTGVLV